MHPKPANVQDEEKWEKAILWAAGDFGFRNCPNFWVDILATDEEGVELAPLRCYAKDENSRTILAVPKKTNTAPPKRGRPVEASTTYRRSGVGMAGQKMPRDRQRFFEIRAPRNTRNRRTAPNIRTFHKKKTSTSCRASVRPKNREVETLHLEKARRKAKKRGESEKRSAKRNFQPVKVRQGEEKNRSKKLGDSCNGEWHPVHGDKKGCGIARRRKMGCPRFSRQRRQSPRCIGA